MRKLKEIAQALLEGIHDPNVVKDLCTPDVTYFYRNYRNPDLQGEIVCVKNQYLLATQDGMFCDLPPHLPLDFAFLSVFLRRPLHLPRPPRQVQDRPSCLRTGVT
jgi:hypothetical protein